MTIPYILIDASKTDWLAFLKRAMVQFDGPNERTRLYHLMKYGPDLHYWSEFVFKAYHHHQQDAVFLTGIPDVKSSLPMLSCECDMAKRKTANPFLGRWLIEHMDLWDVDEESEELQPFIEFERSDTGQFQFACVHGEMDCRLSQRDGQPSIEFTWDGNDESEHAFGRGWVILDGNELNGMIFFHLGDESGFTARRVAKNSGQ